MRSPAATQLLPASVDALKFCQQGLRVSGVLPLTGLQRLSQQLYLAEGDAQAELSFAVDEQSRKVVNGHVEAVLPLVCQRCLERIDTPVAVELALALVWNDDQAAQLPRSLDPVLMETEELDLATIVEEELLLALPLVAMHEEGACQPPQRLAADQALDNGSGEQRVNPFQVLAALKSGVKDSE